LWTHKQNLLPREQVETSSKIFQNFGERSKKPRILKIQGFSGFLKLLAIF